MALGRLIGRRSSEGEQPQERTIDLHPIKLRALESAVERTNAKSFADLGAVWVVEGGYTFHGLSLPGIERATLVDTGITDRVRRKAAQVPLRLLEGNFGDAEMAKQVGPVDVVVLNDVLLHQVNPDWDEVLRIYAPYTNAFVIVEPQWNGGTETVRLLDLGKETYLANIPPEQIEIDFDNLNEIHPKYNRPIRDIHEIWQWGITDADLIRTVTDLGFTLTYWEHGGQWRMLERFDTIAYVFVKQA
jgi:hypothetical protein